MTQALFSRCATIALASVAPPYTHPRQLFTSSLNHNVVIIFYIDTSALLCIVPRAASALAIVMNAATCDSRVKRVLLKMMSVSARWAHRVRLPIRLPFRMCTSTPIYSLRNSSFSCCATTSTPLSCCRGSTIARRWRGAFSARTRCCKA